jgi:hypothetical protein
LTGINTTEREVGRKNPSVKVDRGPKILRGEGFLSPVSFLLPMTHTFGFNMEHLEGVRMLRLVMPPAIEQSDLAAASAEYLSIWDDDRPTVGLGDASFLTEITPEVMHILAVFAKSVAVLPNFVGAAWYTGPNSSIEESLRALASAAGRDPRSVVATEAEAKAYLRERIAAWHERAG